MFKDKRASLSQYQWKNRQSTHYVYFLFMLVFITYMKISMYFHMTYHVFHQRITSPIHNIASVTLQSFAVNHMVMLSQAI